MSSITTILNSMGSATFVDEAELQTRGSWAVELGAMALTPLTATVGTAWSSTLSGVAAGATVTATSSDGVTVSVTGTGAARTLGATFAAGGSKTITVTETLGGSANSPKVQTFAVTAAVVLKVLTLTPVTATAASAYSGTIANRATGSTITATSSDGTTLTVSGNTVSGTFAAAGTPSVSLVETLAGATGSPKTTAITITVS